MPEFRGKKITLERVVKRSSMERWRGLSLNGTPLNDDELATIVKMTPNLKEIELFTDVITDRGMEAICSLPRLVSLLIQRGPQITDVGIRSVARVNNLRELYLTDTQLSDTGIDAVIECQEIWSLIINRTEVTDAGIAKLERLPKLRCLSLIDTSVTWNGLMNVPTTVGQLQIDGTLISDSGIKQFVRSHENLRSISLCKTCVTDDTIAALARLPHLEAISLSNTRITDQGISYLVGHPELMIIHLEGTTVSKQMIRNLKATRKAMYVYV